VGQDDVRRCAELRHVDAMQVHGSLLYTGELDWALPLCRAMGTGVICYGPLAYGLLGGDPDATYVDWRSGTYGMDDFFVAENYARFFAPDVLAAQRSRVRAVGAVAGELGITAAAAALAWLLAQPGVTGAIVGSRSVTHIAANVAAGNIGLSAADVARIESAGRQ
jgi:aryl-alcohol dehydrogenase-like predicted oxidoreductase